MKRLNCTVLVIAIVLVTQLLSYGQSISIKQEEVLIRKIDSLNKAGFNITDYHAHLKGGLTIEQLLAHAKRTGIKYGVAVNGGIGFPIQNDTLLSVYLQSMKNQPVYCALQAEGREWIKLFTPDSVAKFDYVFSDAMTFTDAKGRRMRLWMKNEVYVDDAQQFMDYLVNQIVDIVTKEPINIYVNPTFLPDTIAKRYDELWTKERMMKVIKALKKSGVALEINTRYQIPSAKFIALAKKEGIKFTFGTNNGDANLGYLEYGLQMIDKCKLKPNDFWQCKK